jgi:hypothetical protein
MRRILGLLLISVAPAAWAGSITENTGTAAFINVVQVNGSVTRIDQTSGTHDSFLQNSVAIPALGTVRLRRHCYCGVRTGGRRKFAGRRRSSAKNTY